MQRGWSDEELKASVEAYRKLLEGQSANVKIVKAHVYRELAVRFDRDAGAFERRMQNISSIFQEHGLSWVQGLKPQKNIGSAIKARLLNVIGLPSEVSAVHVELEQAQEDAHQERAFSPLGIEDARKRVVASIVTRRGQSLFRKKLLAAYGNSCVITACQQIEVLEAAHIHPYKGETTDVVSNGLLLRADLHTLFDLYLIAIEPRSRLIRLSPTLKNSEYSVYEGKPLRSPINAGERPSQALMQWHADQCMWFKSPNGSWG